ncbi:MAG: CorA family divalent cation transporter [Christensenellaceae bacterium]|jgi:magnesium transporter
MLVYLDGTKLSDPSQLRKDSDNVLCLAEKSDEEALLPMLFPSHSKAGNKSEAGNYFESHAGYDYVAIKIPHVTGLSASSGAVEIYFSAGKLVFLFNQTKMMNDFISSINDNPDQIDSLEIVLYHFFVRLTSADSGKLEAIEKEILHMEDSLSGNTEKDYYSAINSLRKRLFTLKRYYEALVDLLEDLEENRNNIFSKDALNLFHFHANRVDRLYHEVLNLRDYVTQVRDAYQSQTDITLNKTMRFFTVIATICLPLTLVAGWYGMNMRMPEYDYEYSYPIIIVISAAIVIISVIYFKKKKWF